MGRLDITSGYRLSSICLRVPDKSYSAVYTNAMASVETKKWVSRYAPIVLCILGAWTLFGFFFSTQLYLNIRYHGLSQPFSNILIPWLTCGYLWAALTPV